MAPALAFQRNANLEHIAECIETEQHDKQLNGRREHMMTHFRFFFRVISNDTN